MLNIETSEDIKALQGANAILAEKVRELESKLKDIETSRSWRLTSCLRKIKKGADFILPLWSYARYFVEPKMSSEEMWGILLPFITKRGCFVSLQLNGTGFESIPALSVKFAKLGAERGSIKLGESSADNLFDSNLLDGKLFDGPLIGFNPQTRNSQIFLLPPEINTIYVSFPRTETTIHLNNVNVSIEGSLKIAWQLIHRQLSFIIADPKQLRPKSLFYKAKKAVQLVRTQGISALLGALSRRAKYTDYPSWVKSYDTLTEDDRKIIRTLITGLTRKPCISIVLPTCDTPVTLLDKAVQSVRAQLYDNWQLCIADDSSKRPETLSYLKTLENTDSRIFVVFRDERGHIAAASNSALSRATGEWVTFLDHDDELTEHALFMLAWEINRGEEEGQPARFIYSDEDKLVENSKRWLPYFKPTFNPDLILTQNYICHLTAYPTKTVNELKGFRSGVDGAQDWDLALRVIDLIPLDDRSSVIRRIPHVLYHWRIVEGSTAQSTDSKPYVLEAQKKAVSDFLTRNNEKATVSIRKDISHLKVVFDIPSPKPLVSIIIPTHNQQEVLKRFIDSLESLTTYEHYEVIIIDNNSNDGLILKYLTQLKQKAHFKIIEDKRPFNFSQLNNSATKEASGEILAFCNNDLEVITPEWLDLMVGYSLREGVGPVGARLLYPSGTLQHGGVILGINGVAGHACKGQPRSDPGYWNRVITPCTVSAVTAACMVVKRDLFEKIGGFDEINLAVAFNDIDFCLRASQSGCRAVYVPYAELYHWESVSRGYEDTPEKIRRFERETSYMKRKWGDILSNDPYYNPNLTLLFEDCSLGYPPRAVYPWKIQGGKNQRDSLLDSRKTGDDYTDVAHI